MKLLHSEHQSQCFSLDLGIIPLSVIEGRRGVHDRAEGIVSFTLQQNRPATVARCICSNYQWLVGVIVAKGKRGVECLLDFGEGCLTFWRPFIGAVFSGQFVKGSSQVCKIGEECSVPVDSTKE